MGAFDSVSWETKEAALGPPAPEIEEYVETMEKDVREKDLYDAVKTIHNVLSKDFRDANRTVSGLGEVFITAYLLEKKEIVTPDSSNIEHEYCSLVERRPSSKRLNELF